MKNVQLVPLNPHLKCDEVLEFEEGLNNRIINQPEAVKSMCKMYEQYLAGIPKENRPIGVILLLGNTGTGKTRLAEAVAESLFSNPKAMLKINCAEFQSAHEVAKLIGAPPGYVGHGEKNGAALLSQDKLNAFHSETHKLSIVLFDEIEKASGAFHDILLGILDKGQVTNGRGELIDFTKSIIIMTSNIGAAEMGKVDGGGIGFTSSKAAHTQITSAAMSAVKKKFSPEFINRIDNMVVFNNLGHEEMKQIVKVEIRGVQKRIFSSDKHCQFVLSLSNEAELFLVNDGYDKKYGARHLKRSIEKNLVDPISSMILTGQIEMGDVVHIDFTSQSLEFNKVSADSAFEDDRNSFIEYLESEAAAEAAA